MGSLNLNRPVDKASTNVHDRKEKDFFIYPFHQQRPIFHLLIRLNKGWVNFPATIFSVELFEVQRIMQQIKLLTKCLARQKMITMNIYLGYIKIQMAQYHTLFLSFTPEGLMAGRHRTQKILKVNLLVLLIRTGHAMNYQIHFIKQKLLRCP